MHYMEIILVQTDILTIWDSSSVRKLVVDVSISLAETDPEPTHNLQNYNPPMILINLGLNKAWICMISCVLNIFIVNIYSELLFCDDINSVAM